MTLKMFTSVDEATALRMIKLRQAMVDEMTVLDDDVAQSMGIWAANRMRQAERSCILEEIQHLHQRLRELEADGITQKKATLGQRFKDLEQAFIDINDLEMDTISPGVTQSEHIADLFDSLRSLGLIDLDELRSQLLEDLWGVSSELETLQHV